MPIRKSRSNREDWRFTCLWQVQSSIDTDHPVELTDDSFHKFVTRSDIPVVFDCWATWCPPCRIMTPAYHAAAQRLVPNVILAKVNTEAARPTSVTFDIQGIPCLIAFLQGREVARQSGGMSTDEIVTWVKSVLTGSATISDDLAPQPNEPPRRSA